MRGTLVFGAVLVAGVLGAAAAHAQSGDWAAMTCSDFLKLSPGEQASIAAKVGPTDNARSVTSNSGSNSSSNSTTSTDNTNQMASTGSAPKGTAAGGPVAGQIVAACQAASPSQTLHDIVSTPGAVSNGLGSGTSSQ
jgi:hypothetical protein